MTYVVTEVPITDAAALQTALQALEDGGKTIDFVIPALVSIYIISH